MKKIIIKIIDNILAFFVYVIFRPIIFTLDLLLLLKGEFNVVAFIISYFAILVFAVNGIKTFEPYTILMATMILQIPFINKENR